MEHKHPGITNDEEAILEDSILEVGCDIKGAKWIFKCRQEPVQARMSGYTSMVCRSLDPIPIFELKPENGDAIENTGLEHAFLVVSLILCDQRRKRISTVMNEKSRYMLGNSCTDCCILRDENDRDGFFFVFESVGVSAPGLFCLEAHLYSLEASFLSPSQPLRPLATLYTNVFEVFSASRFRGMGESTRIMEAFKQQGKMVSLRNRLVDNVVSRKSY